MIILMRKRTLIGAALLTMGLVILTGFLLRLDKRSVTVSTGVMAAAEGSVLIWDAGHGGADGGAVSAAGVPESGINLSVAKKCCQLSRFFGCRALLSRTDNGSLADVDANSIRRQKVSDTKNRVALVNGVDNALLFSIHQNSLPDSPKTHGAMVFFNGKKPAAEIADTVQTALNKAVNTDNEKHCRSISSDIYLMAHVNHPAVLVECGFMSNPAEAERLLENTYQNQLACAITGGYLQYKG